MGRLKYLLDTNVLAEPVRAKPNQGVLSKIELHAPSLAICVITWHEMLFGMYQMPISRRRQQIEEYLFQRINEVIPILDFDQEAAQWQAQERSKLIGIGQTPSYVDSQIAAIAAVNDLVLVTRNMQDFCSFQRLQIENWFEL